MYKNPLIESSPALQRLFDRMPPQATSLFSDEQISMLHMGIMASQPRKHAIDIRLSIPLLKMYLVVFGGKERRSRQRLKREQAAHALATVSNLLFLASVLLMMGSIGAVLYSLLQIR